MSFSGIYLSVVHVLLTLVLGAVVMIHRRDSRDTLVILNERGARVAVAGLLAIWWLTAGAAIVHLRLLAG